MITAVSKNQISYKSPISLFFYNRFLKSMGGFQIQFLLLNPHWQTKCTFGEKTNYSNTSTEWTLLDLVFTQSNFGIKLAMIK